MLISSEELWLVILLACAVAGVAVLAVATLSAIVRHIRIRKRPRVVSLVFLGVGFLFVSLYLLLCILESSDCYLYVGGRISQEWRECLAFLAPFPLGIGIILFSVKKLLSGRTVLLTAALVLCLSLYCPLLLFSSTQYVYTEVDPPALHEPSSHKLVFLEKSYGFFGGDGDIYERTSPIVLRKLADYPAHDRVFPVRDGNCEIEWRAEGGTLVLSDGERIDFFFDAESAYKGSS